jgi:dsRNA-specific ribonuclease
VPQALSQKSISNGFTIVNNVERGVGVGKNQKEAREEAAGQAWVAMGWQ